MLQSVLWGIGPGFEFVLLGRLEPLWLKCRETVWK